MRNKVMLITLPVFCLLTNLLFAQKKDAGISTNLGVTCKINTRNSLDFSQMSYFNNNASNLWFTFSDLSFNHKTNDHFSSEFHLRWVNHKLRNGSFQQRQMLYYSAVFHFKIKPIGVNVDIKSRWQYSAIENHWNDSFKGPYFYHRFRINLEKPINYHYKVSFNTEFFEPINRPTHAFIDQIRYTATCSYRKNKNWSFSLSHQTMQQIKSKNPYLYTFVGFATHYTF
ncbi:MAG: DUF2490 domain-containing protein [Sediminibacterium sp.]